MRLTAYLSLFATLFTLSMSSLAQAPADNRYDSAEPPPGITPLPMDLFNTTNFYFDSEYWEDPRYTRCNTPAQLTNMWVADRVGHWGDCSYGISAPEIFSPYAHGTAEEHYRDLMARAKEKGTYNTHTPGKPA